MDALNNPKIKAIGALFLLFALGLFFYASLSGLLLILSIFVFGGMALLWKEEPVKIAGLGALVLLAIFNIAIHGLQFGIDFSGGTRIPILLEHSVDQKTMNDLTQTIKKRVSVLGLSEAKVRAIGSSQIDVEIPGDNPDRIRFIQDTLSHQGVFAAVVEGNVALRGEDIFAASVAPVPSSQLSQGAAWGVGFSLTQEGAGRFAQAAKGQANRPLFMFLDRPGGAVIFMDWAHVQENDAGQHSRAELLRALNQSSRLDEKPLFIYILDDLNLSTLPAAGNVTALVPKGLARDTRTALESRGYILREVEEEALAPTYTTLNRNELVVEKWEAAGLLSMAVLNPGVTQGAPIRSATITGGVPGTDAATRAQLAQDSVKRIESILKGGSLPVQISLGSSVVVPPALGQEFLRLSLIGIVGALAAISIFIGLRYRHASVILPIITISISELIILLSILGSYTIDLAAMAGMIAAIGVGVDAQIVITDELLKKEETVKERMSYAFTIIKTSVMVAIVGMIPLLFSGLVEVINFAISTILGALLGFLLSRPAYAVLAEHILGKDVNEKNDRTASP